MQKKDQLNEGEFIKQSILCLCSSLEPDIALKNFLNFLKDVMPVSKILITYYNAKTHKFLTPGWASLKGGERAPHCIDLPPKAYEKMNENLKKEIVSHVSNEHPIRLIGEDVFFNRWPEDSHVLNLRVRLANRYNGGFSLVSKEKTRFTEKHIRWLASLREPISMTLSNALRHQEILESEKKLIEQNQNLQKAIHQSISPLDFIGADSSLKQIVEQLFLVRNFDTHVLLLGETGVGKDVIANALHLISDRKVGPFVKVNCGAIPESLIDSELFGHEKGSFTDARNRKPGKFEQANNGTLFLDEVGELSLAAQTRLLRVLQTKEIELVGGTETISVNVRIISATHRNLQEMVTQGQFREDLWFRLNVFPINLPPLRERKEDIPDLVRYFIRKKSLLMGIKITPAQENEILESIQPMVPDYQWPGNIRELENLTERALIKSQSDNPLCTEEIWGSNISHPKINVYSLKAKGKKDFPTFKEMCSNFFEKALELSNGQIEGKGGAAQLVDIHPNTLRAKLAKIGVAYGRAERR